MAYFSVRKLSKRASSDSQPGCPHPGAFIVEQANCSVIKLAVDIERNILAGGGELHVDCEQILLTESSLQANVWGADWYPLNQTVGYESIINIRPSANNRSMEIQSPEIREKVSRIAHSFLGGVQWQ